MPNILPTAESAIIDNFGILNHSSPTTPPKSLLENFLQTIQLFDNKPALGRAINIIRIPQLGILVTNMYILIKMDTGEKQKRVIGDLKEKNKRRLRETLSTIC